MKRVGTSVHAVSYQQQERLPSVVPCTRVDGDGLPSTMSSNGPPCALLHSPVTVGDKAVLPYKYYYTQRASLGKWTREQYILLCLGNNALGKERPSSSRH